MTLGRHLEAAAERLEEASQRMAALRGQAPSPDQVQDWLGALTDYADALSEIQRLATESIHEKLHAIAGRLGAEDVL